ncbi:hypothetical protein N7U66_05180 [Lacinutrix neustonica]|uniref:Uncharacterized protein n=1 Tax=Lacinutrix neustonica TaxID=2980107 RepID=A0A9E8MY52_9FLAO|nr:hypothetical protein [Lacinutrix neustonica]WAC03024.1 hypothetical protein N7U66_05180 [Lacinutrix neustonica]
MYKEKTDRELIELLAIHKKLTFQSQLNLKAELNHRNIQENITDLENTISEKISEIENLDYLKNLGFKADKFGNSIKVTRTDKAVLVDIVAIVLGTIFCLIGFFGILGLIGSFSSEGEFSIFSLITEIGMIAIGILGVKFLSGIKRLIDYAGFELLNNNGTITLKKRFDTKLVEIQKNESLLELKEQSELMTLKLENDDILSANTNNIIQKMTISELTKRLKTVANNV